MLSTAIFMASATLLAKLLGLVRDSLLGAYFGTGIESDAFLTASTLPTTLFDIVIGGVISASFIPVFNQLIVKDGKEKALKFVNKFVTMILMVSTLIAVIGIIFRSPLVTLMAPNYAADKHNLAASLTAIMFPMIIFTGLAFSFVGLLQSFGEYNIPSVISLVSNLAIIIYYVTLGNKFGIYGLAVTMVIAWSLQLIIQIPWIRKFGVRYRPDFHFRDDGIKQALKLAGPMLIATWVQPLYSIINQRLASNVDAAVSYIQWSNRLYIIVVGVFSFVVTNLIFPKLSKAVADKDENEAKRLTVTSVKAILAVIMPLMAGFIILSKPIAEIIYGHGKMSPEDINSISVLLKCYCTGMVGLALNEILSKVFFSRQDSKTPMVNSIISMVVNIVLAYVLHAFFSTNGLAVAAACGSIVNALLNYICLVRKSPGLFEKKDGISILKTLFAAIIMAVPLYFLYMFMSRYFAVGFINNIILAICCTAAGVIIYFAFCLIFKVDTVTNLLNSFRRKNR